MGKTVRVLDFETTGLPADEGGAAVCEAGFCDVSIGDDGAARVEAGAAVFVNPGRLIPATARAVHHISDDDVRNAENLDGVLASFVPPGLFALAAHVADFESAFFQTEMPWICTYKVALRLWPDAPAHGCQVLRYHLGLPADAALASPTHRAGPDAYVTAHLLARCLNEGRATLEDMIRWSAGPALLPRITFGKHRGSKWEDAPSDYLAWIVDKSDMDRDVKANARHHLKLRSSTGSHG